MDFTFDWSTLISILGIMGLIAIFPWLKIEVDFLLHPAPEEFKHPSAKIIVRASNLGIIPLTGHLLLKTGVEETTQRSYTINEVADHTELTLLTHRWKKSSLSRSSSVEIDLGYLRFMSKDDDLTAARTIGGIPPKEQFPEIEQGLLDSSIEVKFIPSGIYILFPRFLLRKKLSLSRDVLRFGKHVILSAGTSPEWNPKWKEKSTTNQKKNNIGSTNRNRR